MKIKKDDVVVMICSCHFGQIAVVNYSKEEDAGYITVEYNKKGWLSSTHVSDVKKIGEL